MKPSRVTGSLLLQNSKEPPLPVERGGAVRRDDCQVHSDGRPGGQRSVVVLLSHCCEMNCCADKGDNL